MQQLNTVIDALMELYFHEKNTISRYNMLKEVEDAMKYMREYTQKEIINEEAAANKPSTEISEEFLLQKMSKVVSEASGVEVHLTPTINFDQISKIGTLDSLDMVEIVLQFEEILDVNIQSEDGTPDGHMSLRDVLDLRK